MKELFSKNAKTVILFLCIAIGIVLICFPWKSEEDAGEAKGGVEALERYGANLEKRLEHIVEGIEGTGDIRVMITFDGSFEKIYANNARVEEDVTVNGSSGGKTTEKKIVLAGSGTSGEAPVLLKEVCPKVKGVAVICKGAGKREIASKIKSAASALFGISELKVYVAEGA